MSSFQGMGIKFFIIALVLFSQGCGKEKIKPCLGNGGYSFSASSSLSPQQNTYNVGDTLFFKSTIPKTLQDNINSSFLIDYSNSSGISGNFFTFRFDTLNRTVIGTASPFNFFAIQGQTTPIQNTAVSGITYSFKENSTYVLIIAVILKEKGLFYVGTGDCYSPGLPGKRCTEAGFSTKVTNTNKNFEIFEYALGYLADAIQQSKSFCFRVQ